MRTNALLKLVGAPRVKKWPLNNSTPRSGPAALHQEDDHDCRLRPAPEAEHVEQLRLIPPGMTPEHQATGKFPKCIDDLRSVQSVIFFFFY